jgi:hypothetical protein
VADVGRRRPDARAPRRQPRDPVARALGRRARGRRRVPREASAELPRRVSTDLPDFFPWWDELPFE